MDKIDTKPSTIEALRHSIRLTSRRILLAEQGLWDILSLIDNIYGEAQNQHGDGYRVIENLIDSFVSQFAYEDFVEQHDIGHPVKTGEEDE